MINGMIWKILLMICIDNAKWLTIKPKYFFPKYLIIRYRVSNQLMNLSSNSSSNMKPSWVGCIVFTGQPSKFRFFLLETMCYKQK